MGHTPLKLLVLIQRLLVLVAVSLTAVGVVWVGPAGAQGSGEARLGGGGDLSNGVVITVPQGVSFDAVHHLFVDNPEDSDIEVKFVADAPAGVTITPQWDTAVVESHGVITNAYTIEVSEFISAGRYPVLVQLVRSDITAAPGVVTNVPAIGATFTLHVVGKAGTVTVTAIGRLTGQPVNGTITVDALTDTDQAMLVARVEGATLTATLAPGRYRTRFLLGNNARATKTFTVTDDHHTTVTLEVDTVTFTVAAARPTYDGDTLIVVDLVASVQNHVEPISGPATIDITVHHNDQRVETRTLLSADPLPLGITDAATTYRPPDSWAPGTWTFTFTVTTPEFILTHPDIPTITVAPTRVPPPKYRQTSWITTATVTAIALVAVVYALARRRGSFTN